MAPAFCEERHGVVKAAPFTPWKRDDQRGTRRAFLLQGIESLGRGFDECWPQHQILRRVTHQHQFGKDNEVCSKSSGLISGAADDSEVAIDVADDRIDLRDRYRKGHFEPIVTYGCALPCGRR